jgi:RNA polymerase sigma factor (TIGR02999 family)
MTETPHDELTEILLSFKGTEADGHSDTDRIFKIVYNELRRIAGGLMRAERPEHTLQPTALVNEAYCRLVDQTRMEWQNRAHFFGVAARAMRQILVDYSRKRNAAKRGGDLQRITLDERLGVEVDMDLEVFELDEALTRLAQMDERMAQVVELRVFGGMTVEEVAHILGVSMRTVQNDWRVAKMWLSREFTGGETS